MYLTDNITRSTSGTLRMTDSGDGERSVNDQFGESLIFCLKIPFGELFSKIIFKSPSDDFIFGKSRKLESAVKVRFFT